MENKQIKTKPMDEKALKDILDLLKQARWEAYACDTPLPLYIGAAHCGNPVDGKRFDEYLKLAQKFERLLREKALKTKNRAKNQKQG